MKAQHRGQIHVKRIYEAADPSDGMRVLVDRLWPRGVSKDHAQLDAWMRELTPSASLRQWYHEDPTKRWNEFAKRYRAELTAHADALGQLRRLAQRRRVTLLTAAADVKRSHVEVLRQRLGKKGAKHQRAK